MRCAGPCSIADRLARNIGVAQQARACSRLTPLFTGVRGRGILRSPYPASCIARSSGASKARIAPSNTKPKRYMLW